METELGEKFNSITKVIFQKRVIFVAAILLVLVFCGYFFLKGESGYTFTGNSIVCDAPAEIGILSDGSTLVGDGYKDVFCIGANGELKFKITMDGDNEITGIAVGSNDNIYAYISIEDKGGANVIRDEIWKFDSNGKRVKKLTTLDYSNENKDKDISVRTTPLRYQNGYLCFAAFHELDTDLYKVNVTTGRRTLMGKVKSSTVFGYTDLEPNYDGTYYYIKASGEVGLGKIGGAQKVLCTTNYDIKTCTGIRPFYVRNVGSKVYIMDYWSGGVYQIKDGKLITPELTASKSVDLSSVKQITTELNTSNGKLCGITDGTPWTTNGTAVKPLVSTAKVSFLQIVVSRIAQFMQLIGIPFMVADILFIMLALIWMVVKYGRHFIWKLVASFLLIFIVFIISSYFVFSNEQNAYVKEYLDDQQHEAELAVNTLNVSDVKAISTSSDMTSPEYNRLNKQLIDDFSIYQKDSDTAAILFVPDGSNSNTMIASNRGFGGLLGNSAYYDNIIKSLKTNKSYSTLSDTDMVSCVKLSDANDKTIGYLVIYTASKNINQQFFELWSLPIIAISLILILLALFLSSTFVSKTMTKISSTIKGIIGGDYSIRLQDLPNDEIGEVGQCVNTLSQNIETLIAENNRKNKEIQKSQKEVLISLASITEVKSGQTAAHVQRVGQYVAILARDLGYSPEKIRYISTASMLHDVGKLITPNEILEKPGKLTDEEFERMKTHTVDGERLLHNGTGEIIRYARIIALEHHEKWDGSGYPRGLSGEHIDLTARITAVADVFDALVSKRSYKSAMTPDEAYMIIVSERGQHFDPKVVDVFVRHFDEFKKVMADYPDID